VKFSKRKISLLALFCVLLHIGNVPSIRTLGAEERPVGPVGNHSVPSAEAAGMKSGPEGLQSTVVFAAKDSVIYNIEQKTMTLSGRARIDQEDTTVKAPEIIVNFATSSLDAFGTTDSLKQLVDPAVFSDKQGSFNSETLSYNFKTRKGQTSNVTSNTRELIFSGENVTRLANGEMIIKNGTFTTCDDPEPHYWFKAGTMRIIPDSRIIASPLVMYIRPELFSKRLPAIPILPLPYMVFPAREGRASGFLIPRLSHDSDRGYYLSNFGYFWAINDYLDLRTEGDLAFNGSWRLGERFRYAKRYAFTGTVEGEYERYLKNKRGDADYAEYDSWSLRLTHVQDFDPSTRLDVNVQLQGGDRNYDVNTINQETIINEQANSFGSLARTFDNENSIATLSYERVDDLRNSNVTQLFGAAFYQNRSYPFHSGLFATDDDWRSRLSITSEASLWARLENLDAISSETYTGDARVQFGYFKEYSEGYKALFTQDIDWQTKYMTSGSFDNDRYGSRLRLPLRVQSTLARYFHVNAGVEFNHYMVGNELFSAYDGSEFKQVDVENSTGFSTWNFSVDASTRLYGVVDTPLFDRLFGMKALRHTFIPKISYTWSPDFTGEDYDYYRTVYNGTAYARYNRFANSAYSDIASGQNTIGITLKNLFHGKFRDSETTAGRYSSERDRTMQLLSFTASTAYNFSAESQRFSPLVLEATSNAFSPDFFLSAGAVYDFYGYDKVTGERSNRFNADDGRGLLRFVNGFLNMSFNIHGDGKGGSGSGPIRQYEAPMTQQAIFRDRFRGDDLSNFTTSFPWQLRLSLYLESDRTDPLLPAQTTSLLNASANFAVSKNWQVGFVTGYDIGKSELIFPMVHVYRDLHCWQMGFQWVPFGEFQSYSFQIGLKASLLQDIRFKTSGSSSSWTN